MNKNTGWYEMFYRGYDPALGRMLQVDPLAAKFASHTPYNYGVNCPSYFNDPLGAQSKAPPGVSQVGWQRYQKINDRGNPNYFADWAESFGGAGTIVLSEVYNTRGSIVGYSVKILGPNVCHFSSTSSFVHLDKAVLSNLSLPLDNNTDFEAYLDEDRIIKPNSLRTLFGRDGQDARLGHFTGITKMSDDDLLHLLGYADYLFFDKYSDWTIEDVARFQSGTNQDLDFKNKAYELFDIGRDELLEINGTTYNPNEAGNYLWGMVLEFRAIFIDPNWAADMVTRDTQNGPDEAWEQRAILSGRNYGRALNGSLSRAQSDRITQIRNQYRLGRRP